MLCSPSKPIMNVALSSPAGYRTSCRLTWVGSLPSLLGAQSSVQSPMLFTPYAHRVGKTKITTATITVLTVLILTVLIFLTVTLLPPLSSVGGY